MSCVHVHLHTEIKWFINQRFLKFSFKLFFLILPIVYKIKMLKCKWLKLTCFVKIWELNSTDNFKLYIYIYISLRSLDREKTLLQNIQNPKRVLFLTDLFQLTVFGIIFCHLFVLTSISVINFFILILISSLFFFSWN